jgi:predicted O-methyltransferase YrrM
MNKTISFLSRVAKIVLNNPADLRVMIGTANSVAEAIESPSADTRVLPRIDYADITGAPSRFIMQTFPGIGASISMLEGAALAALIKKVGAKRIFEFGTYKGVSTTQLALNLPDDGMVYTLDLPEDHPAYTLAIPKAEERQIAAETGKGILIPQELRSRVTFLRSDSATFDTTPFLSSMDLVFVDGAHSYEYVKNDTEKGWEMLRPGGIIAWHDCTPSHPEVVLYLKSHTPIPTLVRGTALAFVKK